MRIMCFGHDWLKGHLLRESEINKDLVIVALTIAHQQPMLYHDFGCLHFIVILLIFLVRIGAIGVNCNFTISVYFVDIRCHLARGQCGDLTCRLSRPSSSRTELLIDELATSAWLTPPAARPHSFTLSPTFTEARRVTASSAFSRVAV